MNEENDKKIRELLRRVMPPLGETELKRDLWPQMMRKLDERRVRVPWFDWALVALVLAWLLFFPGTIPELLYHL